VRVPGGAGVLRPAGLPESAPSRTPTDATGGDAVGPAAPAPVAPVPPRRAHAVISHILSLVLAAAYFA
jgi:hypothetical protein